MKKPAALANPRYWQGETRQHLKVPRFFVMSDQARLPDPSLVFDHMPKGSAVVLRHTDPAQLAQLAKMILPKARRYGLKVLISNDVRLARRLRADGVHLSEDQCRRGRWRRTIVSCHGNFLITAAQHGAKRFARTAIDAVLLSPAFPTTSHPDAKALGPLQFAKIASHSRYPAIALGGISTTQVRRLRLSRPYGIAAIGGWESV